MFVFFSSWKTVFKHSWQLLDTSQYLAYLSSSSIAFYRNLNTSRQLGGLIEKVSVPSIAPQQLPWSIELVLLWTPLDTCSIAESVEAFKAQHLSTARWIDRESFCPLDSSSTATLIHRAWFAVDTSGHLLDSWICRAFKAQHLSTPTYLSRFTEPLYIRSAWSVLHFPRSLSIALNRFTS